MKPEKSLRIKLISGYILLIIAIFYAIGYIINLSKELNISQEKILQENNKAFQISELISNFYISESTSRVALLSLDQKDIERYNQKMDSLTAHTLEIKKTFSKKEIITKLDSVVSLLDLKRNAFSQLIETRKQYSKNSTFSDAITKINKAQNQYESSIKIEDETTKKPKKGFFRRMSNAFTNKENKELENAKKQQKEILENSKKEGEKNLENFRKKTDDILNNALKEENQRNTQFLKKEEQLIQRNFNFSFKIKELVLSLEEITTSQSQSIFEKNNKNIEQITHNLIRFGIIAVVIILILALILSNYLNNNYKHKKNLEISNKNLEEIMRQKNFFMASITHDMNAPLNTLFGFTELLENSLIDKKHLEYTKNIQQSANYFKNLVDDLSLFSKLEHSFIQLYPAPFHLKDLVHSIYIQQENNAKNKNIELKTNISPKLNDYYIGDAHRITQILTNVVSNAIKFTPQGYVAIAVYPQKNGIEIKITDTGIGIDIKNKEDLYKEFVQAHDQIEKIYGGTGLGLNITKRLISLMNGTIDFESTVGKGTTFTIFLPLKAYSESLVEKNKTIIVDVNKKLINKNILVIDDDQLQLHLLKELLTNKVKSIDTLSDGRNLSNMLLEKNYHLIISDLQMPNFTGYQIIKEIRSQEKYLHIPVIAFSGKIDLDKAVLKQMGFDAVLQKPVNLKKLLETIFQQLKIEYSHEEPLIQRNENLPKTKLYDLSQLYHLFENDKDAVKNILNIFVKNTKKDLLSMQQAYQISDWKEISNIAHKMLPMYRQLCIDSQIEILETLERKIPEIKEEKIKKNVLKLIENSEKILQKITQHIEKL